MGVMGLPLWACSWKLKAAGEFVAISCRHASRNWNGGRLSPDLSKVRRDVQASAPSPTGRRVEALRFIMEIPAQLEPAYLHPQIQDAQVQGDGL